ncbi:MAG: hypothetical protein ACRDPW_02385 [Mycobacteriales bacterium]
MFSERTQVLLSKGQRSRVERLARRRRTSVGSVIREAIDAQLFPQHSERRQSAERLFQLDAPVADWDVMKEEIIRGAAGPAAG